MKLIKYIQDEIFAMSYSRADVYNKLKKYSSALDEHVIKCVLYPENDSYHKWVYKEIAVWLYQASTYSIKKGKLKPRDYLDTIFDSMGTTLQDCFNNLEVFQLDQKHSSHPYPKVEISLKLGRTLFNVYKRIKEACIKSYLEKQSYSVQWYGDLINKIIQEELQL